jgi:hypothetical protein
MHVPPEHVSFVQALPTIQAPLLLQVSGALPPVQPLAPAVQTPVHAPETHVSLTAAQLVPLVHVPSLAQLSVV